MLEEVRNSLTLWNGIVTLPIVGFLAIFIASIYVWRRSGSTYSLMMRLWHALHGKHQCKDPDIGAFLEEQEALFQFRFITGVRARTKHKAKQLIEWTRANNESMSHVAACGAYFDIEKVRLTENPPKNGHLAGRFVLCVILAAICLILIVGIVQGRAITQVKKTGTLFLAAEADAIPLWGQGRIAREECEANVLTNSGFSPEDGKVVCSLFKSGGMGAFLRETVLAQRLLGLVLLAEFSWFLWAIYVWMRQGMNAKNMFARLRSRPEEVSLALVVTDSDQLSLQHPNNNPTATLGEVKAGKALPVSQRTVAP